VKEAEQAWPKASTDETASACNRAQVHRRWMQGLAAWEENQYIDKVDEGMKFGNRKLGWNRN